LSNNTSRELEKKFWVEGLTLREFCESITYQLDNLELDYVHLPWCDTTDTYYLPNNGSSIQFARTRDSVGQQANGEYRILKEITIKAKDKGNNTDRLERNLQVTNIETAHALLGDLIGHGPAGSLTKEEQIWFVTVPEGEVVLSACQINGRAIVFEVEGPTMARVESFCTFFAQKLKPETRSLFEIYILPFTLEREKELAE